MMGVFAEFERSMIQERVRSGIKRFRANGQRWGRRTIQEADPAVCKQILELRRMGLGMGKIGKQLGFELKNGVAIPPVAPLTSPLASILKSSTELKQLPPFKSHTRGQRSN